MAEDVVKTKGKLNSNKANAGGGVTLDHPVIGIVKDNIDPTRSGKIRVQIEGATNNQSNNGDGWTTVQYLSTYFGMVKPTAGQSGNGDYVSNPSAYGQWQSPPDIGTQVLCIFVAGDPSRGYYIGAIVDPEALQMIPAIGSSDNIVANEGEAQGLAGATRLPVTSINTNNRKQADSTNYLDAPKPVHSYTASIMSQQGIIRDPIRGPISSSASREPVSRVGWGVATPGRPIMEGGYNDENLPDNLNAKNQEQLKVTARRGGHSIVMDDGDIIGRDQLIRIRTALGHQIMMSDDGQTLMILHSNGQSYIELGKEGTVDIFSTNSFNVRTQGDINFHADQHINFHATENMNIQAKNLHINTEEDFKMRAGANLQLYSVVDFTVKSLGAAAIKSAGQASLASSTVTFINGLKILLNTGKSSVSPKKVPIITLITQTDTLHDEQKGFIAAPGKLLTVTTRTPAHYPWTNAGQGVDVKSTLDAVKSLPIAPSSGVQKANQEGLASGAQPPAIATIASAPDTKTVSKSVDKTVTNAVMGSVATSAATGDAKQAVTSGAAIVTNVPGSGTSAKSVAVGTYAQSPTQLVNAGVLKPGSDTLVNGLAQKNGATVESIMPKQLFTGKPGAVDLKTYISDTSSQTTAMVTTMQKAQNTLGKVGALTGKEASTQTAGIVVSAATVGVQPTMDAVKIVSGIAPDIDVKSLIKDPSAILKGIPGLGGSSISGIASQLPGSLGKATKALSAIGSGAAAAGLANKLGGLGGISNAAKGLTKGLSGLKNIKGLAGLAGVAGIAGKLGKLGGLFGGGDGPSFTDLVESVKGPAGAAFTSIRDSLKPLQPNVPQNLSAIAKATAATLAGISSSASDIAGEGSDILNEFVNENGVTSITDINELIDNNTVAGITGAFKQVKAQLNSVGDSYAGQSANLVNQIGAVVTNNTTSGVSNDITSQFGGNAVATITGLTKAFSDTTQLGNSNPANLGSIANPMTTLNNIFNDINTDITGVAISLPLTPTNAEEAITNIDNAVNDISGIIGAGPAIANGDMRELSNAATVVQTGASAARSSALASGVNNLPGGQKSVGAVMNNAIDAVNSLPGTEMLGDVVKNIQTSALNEGLKTVNGITSTINTKLKGVLGKEGGLTNLISSALPLGKAAGLLSGLAALGSGGAAKVKMPTVSFNTFDREAIDSQVKTLLDNFKIPLPNLLGDIKESVVNQVDQLIKQNKDAFKVFDELESWEQKIKDATDKLYQAESDFPAGDRGIAAAQNVLDSLINDSQYKALTKKAESIGEEVIGDVKSLINNAGKTASNMLNSSQLGEAVSTIKSSAMEVLQKTASDSTKSAVKSVKGQGATAVKMMQSKSSASEQDINNSIAGIVGPATGSTYT